MDDEHGAASGFGPGRAICVLGGALLIVALFLPWYATGSIGGGGHLTGLALSARAPELGILPALGVAAIVGSVLLSRTPRGVRGSSVPPAAAAGVGLIGIAVALEVGFRLGETLQGWFGTSFWGAVGAGWYAAILGGFLLLAAGFLRMTVRTEAWASAA
jgi:hypothetical protein